MTILGQTRYLPLVMPLGDSITRGDGAATLAAWREPLYYKSPGNFRFVGSQSYAGADGGLAINPEHEGHAFYCIKQGSVSGSLHTIGNNEIPVFVPDVIILAGGTNDIFLNGDDAATVANSVSLWIEMAYYYWHIRTKPWSRIILCTILKRLDAFDATVQAANALLPAVVAGKAYADRVTLLDMYDSITRPVVGEGYNDVVHPSDEGCVDMAARLWPALRTNLQQIVTL